MVDDIKLTAYSQDSEPYRITRLAKVVGYVEALADHYGNKNLFKKLVSLHDHKGELKVSWNNAPSEGEKEFFVKAWESESELKENVIHEVI